MPSTLRLLWSQSSVVSVLLHDEEELYGAVGGNASVRGGHHEEGVNEAGGALNAAKQSNMLRHPAKGVGG